MNLTKIFLTILVFFMLKKIDYFITNLKKDDPPCFKMSNRQCAVCGEFLAHCYSFRTVRLSCDGIYQTNDFDIVNRYNYNIWKVAHNARKRNHRIMMERMCTRNTLRKISPVISPLVEIIAEYL